MAFDRGGPVEPGDYQVCNSIWLLDDFTASNGATRVVPGSHRARTVPRLALADPAAEHPDQVLVTGPAGTVVVFNTLINGLAEEMFFRGALYSALGKFHPVLVSTVVYAIAVSAAGNPMLGFAGLILGVVCAYERRMTGGVFAPMLTHFFWGLVMVLALPPIFGV